MALANQKKKQEAARPIRLDEATARQVRRGFGIDPARLSLEESPEVAAMGARAVAKGNVIRFAPGEFSPGTGEGVETLGHELEHIRAQASGEVPLTGGLLEQPSYEAAADRAGAAFASGTLAAAGPVSPLSGAAAQAAPAQGLFGSKKRAQKKAKKARYEGLMQKSAERFNSRGAQAATALSQAKGIPQSEEDLAGFSRLLQGFVDPDLQENNLRLAQTLNRPGVTSDTISEEVQADPSFVASLEELLQPQLNPILSFDMDRIDLNDPESLMSNMSLLTRAGMIAQPYNDLLDRVPALKTNNPEQAQEMNDRLLFLNNAYTVAKKEGLGALGYRDDPSLYTEGDIRRGTDNQTGKFSPEIMKGKIETMAENARARLGGQSTYRGYRAGIGRPLEDAAAPELSPGYVSAKHWKTGAAGPIPADKQAMLDRWLAPSTPEEPAAAAPKKKSNWLTRLFGRNK